MTIQTHSQRYYSVYDILAAAFSELQELAAECRIDWPNLQFQLPEPSCPIKGKQVPVLQNKDAHRCFFVWHKYTNRWGQEYPVVVFFTHAQGNKKHVFNGNAWLYSHQSHVKNWVQQNNAENTIPKIASAPYGKNSTAESYARMEPARALYTSLPEVTPDNAYLHHKVPDWKSFAGRELGVRQGSDKLGNFIMVPLENHLEGIIGFQKIYDRKLAFAKGNKWTIGRKKGAWFGIQGRPGPLIVTEGLTTGLSIHVGSRASVLVAFDAGNLIEVVKAWPKVPLIIAADNDHRKDSASNVGLASALKAAAIRNEIRIIIPSFGSAHLGKHVSDFNDLHQIVGTKRFQEMLQKPLSSGAGNERYTVIRL